MTLIEKILLLNNYPQFDICLPTSRSNCSSWLWSAHKHYYFENIFLISFQKQSFINTYLGDFLLVSTICLRIWKLHLNTLKVWNSNFLFVLKKFIFLSIQRQHLSTKFSQKFWHQAAAANFSLNIILCFNINIVMQRESNSK